MWYWAATSIVASIMTWGLAWLIFPFFANKQYARYLISKGYLTEAQWKKRETNEDGAVRKTTIGSNTSIASSTPIEKKSMKSLGRYTILGHNIIDMHTAKTLTINLSNEELSSLKKIGVPWQLFRAELYVLSACTALYAFTRHTHSEELIEGFNLFIHKEKSPEEIGFNELCEEIDKKKDHYISIIDRHLQPPELPGELNLTLPMWFMEVIKIRSTPKDDKILLLLSMKYTQAVFWGVYNATVSNLNEFDKGAIS